MAGHVQSHFGGLYEGRLDHLRSTLCAPALGVNGVGCCLACEFTRRDNQFGARLRKISRAGPSGSIPAAQTKKRAMTIGEREERSDSVREQKRRADRVLEKLVSTRDKWRNKFESAVTAAAECVRELTARIGSSVGAHLDAARDKEAELLLA
eukprot:5091860-Prymnesium_polylepis.1